MNRWTSLFAVLSGRWQIPLAICALLAAGIAVYRTRPPRPQINFDAALADVLALAEAGRYFAAADSAANLLALDPPLPQHQRALLHETLAEIIHEQEQRRGLPNRSNVALLLEHHQAALDCGRRPDARALLRAAQAHEWLGQRQPALETYRAVLEQHPPAETRCRALQGLVRLLDGQPQSTAERQACIQALLDEPTLSSAYLWQALRHAVQAALDEQDFERAQQLLAAHADRFLRSDLKGYHDCLWAWVYISAGQTDAAAPHLDRLDEWLRSGPQIDAELERVGYLPAMSRWLRGRLDLAEGRPQAALGCFEEAAKLQPHGPLSVAALIGRAQALAMLERHAAARQAVRAAVSAAEQSASALGVALPRVRQAVAELGAECHGQGDYVNAIAYLELAVELAGPEEKAARLELLEQLGHWNAQAAAEAVERNSARALHAAAGAYYDQAAELALADRERHATLLWTGAAEFDQAGQTADAARLLSCFVDQHPTDPRMPQALLLLGQAHAALRRWDTALGWYQRVVEDYPRLEEASRARLYASRCLAARGEEYLAQAERMLEGLLEDEHIAPQARVFREALVELCDLLYQQGAYARAISRMEDFLAFYPNDAERDRVRFLLADAYRRSAYALRQPDGGGDLQARVAAARERFRKAAALFAAFRPEDAQLTPAERRLYERLALFYQADCLFELNEPASLEEALAIYRQAAARYQNEPAVLAAQVQIANIYLRQGRLTEAARAIERARRLLDAIPERAFAEAESLTDRASWERLLDTVRSSELFRPVFAGAQ